MPSLFPDDPPEPRQRVLDLGHGVASGRADFLVSPVNRAALAWIDRWPEWPSPALAIAGPAGSGKKHLARIWAARAGAAVLQASSLEASTLPDYLTSPAPLILEGGRDRSGDAAFEEAFFHLYNAMRAAGRSLLIIDSQPPARWPVQLPDLASRLATIPVATIEPPDDDLLKALFYKLFADRQMVVPPDVVAYILPRMERSFTAVHRIAACLDETALERKSPVTIAVARAVLSLRA